ncbi:membrane protein insertion efficiency factor YidD [Melioribacteraceae bacterium 4301-Me]|uniref:membrane protein insertion efficiency factor YidD n=1 Tax=Pyranulibacter aquaticus TaxID=3163344 RepID=UPI00359B4E9C
MKIFILFFSLAAAVYSQTDWVRWSGKEISYEIKNDIGKNYSIDYSNLETKLISAAKNIYYFLISDLDGDNCPFYPTCSNFFVASVKSTNLLQGLLMFVDRFTRDVNPVKGTNHYPYYITGKLYDPVYNYTLDFSKIKYQPGGIIIDEFSENR